jgi:hypothetical protein
MPSTANAIVTVEEYLHRVYHPDVDYVDGKLEDRTSASRITAPCKLR